MTRPAPGQVTGRPPAWLPVAALLLAVAARAHGIAGPSLWFDEAWSAHAAARPSLLAALTADPTNPPLYYGLLHVFARGAGVSELSLRYFSLWIGVVAVALCGRLAARLAGPAAGGWAMWAAACAPLLWWSSQEARMYSLLAALALCAAIAWHRLRSGAAGTRTYVALVACQVGLLYAHNTGPMALLWLNTATALGWLADRATRRPGWRAWLVTQATVVLLYAPWLLLRLARVPGSNRVLDAGPTWSLETAARAWTAYWAGTWTVALHEPAMGVSLPGPPFLGVAGVGLVVIAVLGARRRAWWPLVHAALLSTGILVGLWALDLPLHGRYLVVVAPFVATALGIGLAGLPRWPRRAIGAALVGALAAAMAFSSQPRHARDDARGVASAYAAMLTQRDTVVAWSYADRYDLAYYWPRLGVRASRLVLPDGARVEDVARLLPTSGRVAANVWPTQRADVRGMLPCLLGHGSAAPPETIDHGSMQTLLFATPPAETPRMLPLDVTWSFARATGGPDPPEGWPSDRQICARFELALTAPIEADLKARVEARNDLGMTVARQDVLLADDLGRRTSQLGAGDVVSAFAPMALPAGAPGGAYTLTLRLYDEVRRPWGYEATGETSGADTDAVVGTWRVRPSTRSPSAAEAGLPYALRGPRVAGWTLEGSSLAPQRPTEMRPGDVLQVALLWSGAGPLPDLVLADRAARWSVTMERHRGQPGAVTLDWLRARVPAAAPSGPAELASASGVRLLPLSVAAAPRSTVVPPHDARVNARFPGVGTLVGVSARPLSPSRGGELAIDLVWRAEAATDAPLVAFVHLLDALGDGAGQSDSAPGAGERPTTGWRPGEVIVDRHVLRVDASAARGAALLRAGLYDPATGDRAATADGADAVELPLAPEIE